MYVCVCAADKSVSTLSRILMAVVSLSKLRDRLG